MNAKNILLILSVILGVMALSFGVAYYLTKITSSPGVEISPPSPVLDESDKLKILEDLASQASGSSADRDQRVKTLESLFNK